VTLPRPLLAAIALAFTAGAAQAAGTAQLDCTLAFKMKGWSALVEVADGTGTVTCADGSSLPVNVRLRGAGATLGRNQVDNGVGKFTDVLKIDDVLGHYAQSGVHAGLVKSAGAQVLTKGTVSLALAGAGEGIDLGIAVGEFTIEATK